MALTFDVTRIANYEANYPDRVDAEGNRQWNAVTDSLVWLSMFCGFDQIAEENAQKVAHRVLAYQRAVGSVYRKNVDGKMEDLPVTREDVVKHIGFRSNATRMTDAQFERYIGKRVVGEIVDAHVLNLMATNAAKEMATRQAVNIADTPVGAALVALGGDD